MVWRMLFRFFELVFVRNLVLFLVPVTTLNTRLLENTHTQKGTGMGYYLTDKESDDHRLLWEYK